MTERRVSSVVDHEELGAYLRALGVPSRLDLLRLLQVPHSAAEILLHPSRRDRERSPDRPLSRQAVDGHLAVLQEMGLVRARVGEREGRAVTEFIVNHARLFVVTDELRRPRSCGRAARSERRRRAARRRRNRRSSSHPAPRS